MYNLLSLYEVLCMHVFRADSLALDKLVCFSLEKTSSPALSLSRLPIVLHMG